MRDLSEALERAQEENRRSRVLGELGGTIDLDEVLTRTLDAAGALDGVDAAVVSVARRGDERRSSPSVGLGPRRARRRPSPAHPTASTPRSIAIAYDYGPTRGRRRGGAIRARRSRSRSRARASSSATSPRTPAAAPTRFGDDGRRGAGGARAPRRPGDRQRPPLPRGAPARRPRRAHRPAQPPLLPRDAGPRGRPRAALQPQPRARRLRPRRLQGDQRPDRPSRRRRRAGRGGRPRPRRRPLGRRRLPRRRRRVRGDPAGVVAHGRRPALPAARARRLGAAGRRRPAGCTSPPASPSCGPDDNAIVVLRAGRRGALPRQGRRQGHRGRGRDATLRSRDRRQERQPARERNGADRRQAVARAPHLVERRGPAAAPPRPSIARPRAPRAGATLTISRAGELGREQAERRSRRATPGTAPAPGMSPELHGGVGGGELGDLGRGRASARAGAGAAPRAGARRRSRRAPRAGSRGADESAARYGVAAAAEARAHDRALGARERPPGRSRRPAAARAARRASSARRRRRGSRARARRSRSS